MLMKIAVMGAGAVGCYCDGILARAGHHVVLVGRLRRDGCSSTRSPLRRTCLCWRAPMGMACGT
ncbi:ketopantoate reductase family protein [Aromatoleum evansii]|uniref:ketopantoate reductase family protein n=1 Tax=Aromatoleum evansii TaxID=59406 RepID=UPI00388DA02E